MTDDKQKQVMMQCRVVAHLAEALRQVHDDYGRMFECAKPGDTALGLLDQVGQRTARWMETLGDMLNGIDAVEEEDAWVDPIFEEAHRLWPAASPAPQPSPPAAPTAGPPDRQSG
jgi:hypothetical protein